MLVVISDIHLTDGTSGETIDHRAFKKFVLTLEDMADAAKAKEIEIVLLGDIFDLIRSDYWLTTNIRPWSDDAERDGEGNGLQDYTTEVINRICRNPNNRESMNHLKGFRDKMKEKEVDATLEYIIGNHDWLINRYPEAREMIADFLGMHDPQQYKSKPFLNNVLRQEYKVFARHGDVYDPFNFKGNRDASSLGDAIVIDVINSFPKKVADDIGLNTDPDLISQLREIDNVPNTPTQSACK